MVFGVVVVVPSPCGWLSESSLMVHDPHARSPTVRSWQRSTRIGRSWPCDESKSMCRISRVRARFSLRVRLQVRVRLRGRVMARIRVMASGRARVRTRVRVRVSSARALTP